MGNRPSGGSDNKETAEQGPGPGSPRLTAAPASTWPAVALACSVHSGPRAAAPALGLSRRPRASFGCILTAFSPVIYLPVS